MLALKDELQSLKKYLENRTRGVYVCPITLGLLYRKFFGRLIAAFHRAYNHSPSAVGMNVFSGDWDTMIKHLLEVGDFGFDGDFKGFQNLFTTQVMDILSPIILSRFDETDIDGQRARKVLLDILVVHYVAVGGDIFMSAGGNPSGNPLTTLLNTLLCIFIIAVFYHRLAEIHSPIHGTTSAYHRVVRVKSYGDDHVVSVSKEIPWFNGFEVGEVAKTFRITYTAAHKGQELSAELTPIVDLLFLGNVTTTNLGLIRGVTYYARRPIASALKMLAYGSKKLDVVVDTLIRADAFLRLISSNGPRLFHNWRDALRGVCLTVGGKQPFSVVA